MNTLKHTLIKLLRICYPIGQQVHLKAYTQQKCMHLAARRQVEELFFFFCFLGPHVQHMKAPRLEVKSELQLPAYTTATATKDLSCICDLHHS